MTDRTDIFSLRVPVEVKFQLSGYLTRECLEGIARQIENGEIELSERGVSNPLWERFCDRCHDLNVDPSKAMDKCLQMMR